MSVQRIRARAINDAPVNEKANYVLYWMIAFRRSEKNQSLNRAVELAQELGKDVLVFEALRCGYRWASDRIHQFVIDGMQDNQEAFEKQGIGYYPYVEPQAGAGAGLLEALADDACAVITDDFPCFFLPTMVDAAADRLNVRLEVVDDNGLYPMHHADGRVFTRAHSFRRHLQKNLAQFLDAPRAPKYAGSQVTVPKKIRDRWPAANLAELDLGQLPIDHDVAPAERGGRRAAKAQLAEFMKSRFARYGDGRNHPDDAVASGLSPFLHFGFISAREIFDAIAAREDWTPAKLAPKPNGSREGWWGMSSSAESFLDELITWRELGYNMTHLRDDYASYSSLPDWAKQTLAEHADDPRPELYSLEELDESRTADPIWNAAQRELVTTGRMHNYLRMLWGKNVLQWSPSPQQALERLIHLNNKYALDGRNPNSYSGIFWVFGRYDRAWGPERPIFGKIRYMTSESTRKKLRLKGYLKRFSPGGASN